MGEREEGIKNSTTDERRREMNEKKNK